ncbi:MAG TPA: 3-isopropylmalate dehydratase small subunit [Planctomycetota bacterium]|nr:3-isopropylmalate dehydratase small subunit [Planctomycetota bacterium]
MAVLRGRVWRFGDDVNTDEIIPARYLNTSDPKELAAHCMEDADAGFAKKVKAGDFIVAGKNFGCGSSREHAPVAIKAAGVSAVVAESFARIFFRNAINVGLPIVECQGASRLANGGEGELDLAKGVFRAGGVTLQGAPYPEPMRKLIDAGGLMPYVARKLASGRKA